MIKTSRTIHLIKKDSNSPYNTFDGNNSHFRVDHNTMEEILRVVYSWSEDNNDSLLIAKLDEVKPNLSKVN